MTGAQGLVALGTALSGAAVALVWLPAAIARAPAQLVRTNVSGRPVPAVLGLPILAGGMVGLGVAYVLDRATALDVTTTRLALALALVALVAAASGYADDRRGDEPARGFGGHLKAAARGRITGGLVKILGVGAAGLGAGLLLGGGWFTLECAAVVSLTANVINLFDRAPGRAAKVAFLIAAPLVAAGASAWPPAASGVLGSLAACLGPDLREKAMLGDAGANSVGAVLGLGLAASLDRPGRLIALALLVAINLASERWSFSRGIERVGWLHALDLLGRSNRGRTSEPGLEREAHPGNDS